MVERTTSNTCVNENNLILYNRNYDENKKLKRLVVISALLSSPMFFMVVLGGMKSCCIPFILSKSKFEMFMELLRYKTMFLYDWRLQLILATPVQFIIGFRFYKKAFNALKARALDKDVLLVIGTTITFLYSLYLSFYGEVDASGTKQVYYETSMFIITFALLGKYSETKFAKIIKIEEDQSSKVPIQKFADKVSGIFVPLVMLISLLTFIIWYFFIFNQSTYFIQKPILFAVAVLTVASPCALELAVPTAIMVGLGQGEKEGIFIKNGEKLEKKIMWKIKQNLSWAIIYNIVGISFAATGHLSPRIAAGASVLCSIVVLVNSLSLKRYRYL